MHRVYSHGYLALALALLTSCGATKQTPTGGQFNGDPHLVSVGPNQFLFHQPKGEKPFSFTTSKHPNPTNKEGIFKHKGRTITPETMLTTGASVPRPMWWVPGLGAFDYSRAAIIHDWLFEAKHRYDSAKRQGNAALEKKYSQYADIDINDAADIYAECILTIMAESVPIREKLKELKAKVSTHQRKRLEELEAAFRAARPSDMFLSAHRHSVSDRCPIPISKKKWEAQHDDLAVYTLLGTAGSEKFMSPWLQQQFRLLGAEGKIRAQEFQKQIDTDARTPGLRPRVYLEVPDLDYVPALRLAAKDAAAAYDFKSAAKDSSIGKDEVTITYYTHGDEGDAEEKALAEQLLRLLPDGKGRVRAIDAMTLNIKVRPKHFDLRIGSNVIAELTK
jgi:hypothetical protein